MSRTHDHEIVSIYPFTDDEIEALMTNSAECVLMWATKDGWPVGVVHAFVWRHERIWVTFAAHRHRAAAIRRDPRVSVTVSGTAGVSRDCPRGAVTVKGRAIFHEDQETKDWFYRALARKLNPGDEVGQDRFFSVLDSPLRVILEIVPEKWITFDGVKSARDMVGKLAESEKTPAQSADVERMNEERRRRGLAPRAV
jgi:general stress protein 26